eukprot:2747686-Ditylum_brightwellii.AAC.1
MNRKDTEHTQFYFINPNGISLKKNGIDFKVICEDAKERDIDYTCLSETKLDMMSPEVKNILHDQSRKTFKHRILQATSALVVTETFHKPGGVLSLVQGPLVVQKISSGSNELGQWTCTKFARHNNKVITAMTVYQ